MINIDKKILNKSGIYSITNKLDNRRYIGKAKKFRKRFYSHKSDLKGDRHHCNHLQNAWNKYGEENFEFEIIEIVDDLEKLVEREQYWADYYQAFNGKNGYNCGECMKAWNMGIKYSDELRKKLSDVQKKLMTPERAHMLRTMNIGRKFGPEFKEKCRKSFKGKHHTEENKKRMSDAQREVQKNRTTTERRAIFAHEMICIYLISPNSEIYEVWGVREFCREYKLDRAAIMRVVKGQNRIHKGWTRFDKDNNSLSNKIIKDYRK